MEDERHIRLGQQAALAASPTKSDDSAVHVYMLFYDNLSIEK